MERNAICYLRWSTLEQGNSDRSSEDRQDINTRRISEQSGWPISMRVVDSGRSAYTGSNLIKGELGRLTNRLLSGAIDPRGHVLVVEELDRLSRQPPGTMTAWLTPLLSAGLWVCIANTGQIIKSETMERDFGGFVTLMSQAFSAHDFSRKQSERGASSWRKRRQAAAEGMVLSRHRSRGWLSWNTILKRYEPIPDRVWLVHEMFRLRLAGYGKGAVAKMFNERAANDARYAPWSTSRTPPKNWTATAIGRVVQDRAVVGYVQYHLHPRGAERKVATGEPLKVYPAIVDEETWARANDTRVENQLRHQGRGRAVSNLLGPLAKCKVCGGAMQPLGSSRIRMRKDGSRTQHYFLYCQNAKMTKGVQCTNQRGWPYAGVERPIIERLLSLAIDDQHFRSDDETTARLEGELVCIQAQVNEARASKNRILAIIEADDDPEAVEAYQRTKARLIAFERELATSAERLSAARGLVPPGQHIVRVAEVRNRMDSESEAERYEARNLVKSAFQSIIERIDFNPSNGLVTVRLIAGLGAMHIFADGRVGYLDLVKAGRLYGEGLNGVEQDIIKGFLRRRA